jgi:hypothetical protein
MTLYGLVELCTTYSWTLYDLDGLLYDLVGLCMILSDFVRFCRTLYDLKGDTDASILDGVKIVQI